MRIHYLISLFMLAGAPAVHAVTVTYAFSGVATTLPNPNVPLPDRSQTAMTGKLIYDTDYFLTNGPCYACRFSYEITVAGMTWYSKQVDDPFYGQIVPLGSLTASGGNLDLLDEAPQPEDPSPDAALLRLSFSSALQPGGLLPLADFSGGMFGLVHFFQYPSLPQDSISLSGVITQLELVDVPVPATGVLFASALLGLTGVVRRRKVARQH